MRNFCDTKWNLIYLGKIRVLSTDYEYALIAECYKENEDGTCVEGYGNVEALSRKPEKLPVDVANRMLAIAGKCFKEEDFADVSFSGIFFISE